MGGGGLEKGRTMSSTANKPRRIINASLLLEALRKLFIRAKSAGLADFVHNDSDKSNRNQHGFSFADFLKLFFFVIELQK